MVGLYAHDEITYERWIPSSERIYQVAPALSTGQIAGAGPSDLGLWLASDYPQFEAVTRLFRDQGFFVEGDRRFNEPIVWADPNVFDVFRFPVVAARTSRDPRRAA